MPRTARRATARRHAPVRRTTGVVVPRSAGNVLVDSVTGAVEQLQRQFSESLDDIRLRAQEAAEEAAARASVAGDFALKLAYAYVGAVSLAQEEITTRIRRARS